MTKPTKYLINPDDPEQVNWLKEKLGQKEPKRRTLVKVSGIFVKVIASIVILVAILVALVMVSGWVASRPPWVVFNIIFGLLVVGIAWAVSTRGRRKS